MIRCSFSQVLMRVPLSRTSMSEGVTGGGHCMKSSLGTSGRQGWVRSHRGNALAVGCPYGQRRRPQTSGCMPRPPLVGIVPRVIRPAHADLQHVGVESQGTDVSADPYLRICRWMLSFAQTGPPLLSWSDSPWRGAFTHPRGPDGPGFDRVAASLGA